MFTTGLALFSSNLNAHSPTHNQLHSTHTGIIDSDASGTYFAPNAPVTNLNPHAPTICVGKATGQLLTSSASSTLDLPSLPLAARDGHVMSSFKHTLISVGKLCDAGCAVTFTQSNVTVVDETGRSVLQGWCEEQGAYLWRFNLHNDALPEPIRDYHSPPHQPVPSKQDLRMRWP
jgi:hypothetical protein